MPIYIFLKKCFFRLIIDLCFENSLRDSKVQKTIKKKVKTAPNPTTQIAGLITKFY